MASLNVVLYGEPALFRAGFLAMLRKSSRTPKQPGDDPLCVGSVTLPHHNSCLPIRTPISALDLSHEAGSGQGIAVLHQLRLSAAPHWLLRQGRAGRVPGRGVDQVA